MPKHNRDGEREEYEHERSEQPEEVWAKMESWKTIAHLLFNFGLPTVLLVSLFGIGLAIFTGWIPSPMLVMSKELTEHITRNEALHVEIKTLLIRQERRTLPVLRQICRNTARSPETALLCDKLEIEANDR